MDSIDLRSHRPILTNQGQAYILFTNVLFYSLNFSIFDQLASGYPDRL